jgi:hypothetical protein
VKKFTLKIVLATIMGLNAVPLLSLAKRYYFEYEVYDSATLDQYVGSIIMASVYITSAVAVAIWAFATSTRDWEEEN